MIELNIMVFDMKVAEDLTGKKYHDLVVIGKHVVRNKWKQLQWLCRCKCGEEVITTGIALRNNNKKSCGCARGEKRVTHGMTHSAEYKTWQAVLQRCHNKKSTNYENYGGRGILVCARWANSFENFYEDMGPKPGPEYSIERDNTEWHYEPDNCRWATVSEQLNNKRDNVKFEYGGFVKTVTQLAQDAGLKRTTLDYRLRRGASIEEAMTRPLQRSIQN